MSGQTVNSSDHFGWSVSISTDGSLAIVGARYTDSPEGDAGSAYVFKRTVTAWDLEQRLTSTGGYGGTDGSDYFGYSVDISGDGTRVIVGAYGDNGINTNLANQGSAHIFRRDATTTPISWVYEKELQHTSSMQSVDSSDQFGWSVSISNDGNRVIAGAQNTDQGGGNAGSAYVFDRTTGTNDWTFNTMLVHPTPNDGGSNDYFGENVAISGDGTHTICGVRADDNPGDSGSAQVFNFKSQLADTSTQVFTVTGTGITDRSIVQLEGQNGTLYNVFDVTTPNAAGTEITFKMGSLGASGGYSTAQQPYKVKITAASSISATSTAMIGLAPVWTTASARFYRTPGTTLVAKDGANVSSSGSWAGTFSVVSANLPPGLTLNPSTGLLSGTVDAGYSTPETIVTFRVTDNVNLLFADRVFIFSTGQYEWSQNPFTFTNAGVTGRTGPTIGQMRSAYSPSWTDDDNFLSVTGTYGGIQQWTVPVTGSYRIEAFGAKSEWGARGGSSSYRGGYGASMRGDFTLTGGEIIKILVGQNGVNGTHTQNTGQPGIGAGGGGTFVVRTPYDDTASILVIAGGGGGGAQTSWTNRRGDGGNTGTSGTGGGGATANDTRMPGGSGGNGGQSQYAGGGAGFTGNGANPSSSSDPSRSFTNGGRGGQGGRSHGGPELYGGFGGGGGAGGLSSGGGGGYSGGGSGQWSSYMDAGGGGSYNNGTNQSNTGDTNNGHGKVIITLL